MPSASPPPRHCPKLKTEEIVQTSNAENSKLLVTVEIGGMKKFRAKMKIMAVSHLSEVLNNHHQNGTYLLSSCATAGKIKLPHWPDAYGKFRWFIIVRASRSDSFHCEEMIGCATWKLPSLQFFGWIKTPKFVSLFVR